MVIAEMKTLTIENTTFEIVDAQARERLDNLPEAEELTQVTENVTQMQTTVTEMQTQIESKVDTETVTQLETDLKTYVDEQIKTVTSDSIDDGVI